MTEAETTKQKLTRERDEANGRVTQLEGLVGALREEVRDQDLKLTMVEIEKRALEHRLTQVWPAVERGVKSLATRVAEELRRL